MSTETAAREEWLEARLALLREERALTRQRDAVSAKRRALPRVRVEKDYRFDGPKGETGLADLFEGRGQLFVQHFMLAPDSDSICKACSFMADSVDAARRHFEHADLAFAAVSRAPLARIEDVRRRMDWRFTWVSSGDNGFNRDFGVSYSEEEAAEGAPRYNYGTTAHLAADLPGISVFARGGGGEVHHCYSTYARGLESMMTPFHFLDLTPGGRAEEGAMSWVRLHDEYE